MAALPDKFLSCDWGTSSFRLRLVSMATIEVLAEVQSNDGVKSLLGQNWPAWSRPDLFADVMRNKIEALADKSSFGPLPLVISGMASSSIGWKPLPYAHIPMSIDGSGLYVEDFEWEAPPCVVRTLLISGAKSVDDIMRGEECQTIGLFTDAKLQPLSTRAVLVLPGTHSKHIFLRDRKIVSFRTFMTGELFEILSRYSILSDSIQIQPQNPQRRARSRRRTFDRDGPVGFVDGVNQVRASGLSASLFRIRTRSVLDNKHGLENSEFLSGVLIGAEITELVSSFDSQIIIAGERADLYKIAFKAFGKADAVTADLDNATMNGHRLILSKFYS